MKTFLYGCSTFIFFGLLLFPAAQYFFDLIPRKGLTNVSIQRDFPKLSLESFQSGRFQEAFNTWVTRNNGLFGYFVRSENQLNFTLFKQISASYNASVKLGKDNYLFQSMYLKDLNGQAIYPETLFLFKIEKLKQLKEYLNKRGKSLLVLITPNKVLYEPSIVPSYYLTPNYQLVERGYDQLKRLMIKEGIDFIDGPLLFKENAKDLKVPFFSASGSHYNSVGGCLISKAVLDRMSVLMKKPLRKFQCSKDYKWRDIPKGPDRDLSTMINIWFPQTTFSRTPYTEPEIEDQGNIFRPKVLVVGTSFLWSVFEVWERIGVYSRRFFFYYYNTNYYYYRDRKGSRKRGKHGINKSGLDWEKYVFSNDVIILEANQSLSHNLGFGFLEEFGERIQKNEGVETPNAD